MYNKYIVQHLFLFYTILDKIEQCFGANYLNETS